MNLPTSYTDLRKAKTERDKLEAKKLLSFALICLLKKVNLIGLIKYVRHNILF